MSKRNSLELMKDGIIYDREESKGKRKGFRAPLTTIKLKNPFHIYHYMFNYNKDYTKVPTLLLDNKNYFKKYIKKYFKNCILKKKFKKYIY